MTLKSRLKNIFKANPLLYRIWYHLYRKRRGVKVNWFNKATELFIDGYPRSANTFTRHLTRNIWPEMEVVHHFHVAAPLKIALQKQLPIFVLLREPAGAISSYYLKHFTLRNQQLSKEIDEQILEAQIVDYVNYYRYVLSVRDQIEIIAFEEITGTPAKTMQRINEAIPPGRRLKVEELEKEVERVRQLPFGAKSRLGASLPTKEKEERKKPLQEAIRKHPRYMEAVAIYEQLANPGQEKLHT